MKTFVGGVALFFLVMFIAAFLFLGDYSRYSNSHPTETFKEFYDLLDRSNGTLDLRKIKTVDWDEAVIWIPYSDICDYGINDYIRGGSNCKISSDDGECYLLLLKTNKLAAKISINRKKIDLAISRIEGRIPHDRSVLKYNAEENWPKAKLIASE